MGPQLPFPGSSRHRGSPLGLEPALLTKEHLIYSGKQSPKPPAPGAQLMPSLGIQELLFAQRAIFTLLLQLNLWALGRFES